MTELDFNGRTTEFDEQELVKMLLEMKEVENVYEVAKELSIKLKIHRSMSPNSKYTEFVLMNKLFIRIYF